jgi:hypothetical protein
MNQWFSSQHGQEIYFLTKSIAALGPTHLKHETDYSPPPRAKVRNAWSYTRNSHMPSWHAYGYTYLFPWFTPIKNTSLTTSKILHLLCSQDLLNYFQNLPLDPTLGQVNPAHSLNSSRFTLILSFLTCHSNPKWSSPSKYSDSTIYHTCLQTHPSHPPAFIHPSDTVLLRSEPYWKHTTQFIMILLCTFLDTCITFQIKAADLVAICEYHGCNGWNHHHLAQQSLIWKTEVHYMNARQALSNQTPQSNSLQAVSKSKNLWIIEFLCATIWCIQNLLPVTC